MGGEVRRYVEVFNKAAGSYQVVPDTEGLSSIHTRYVEADDYDTLARELAQVQEERDCLKIERDGAVKRAQLVLDAKNTLAAKLRAGEGEVEQLTNCLNDREMKNKSWQKVCSDQADKLAAAEAVVEAARDCLPETRRRLEHRRREPTRWPDSKHAGPTCSSCDLPWPCPAESILQRLRDALAALARGKPL